MDLKPRLEDYTEHEFLQLTNHLWHVHGSEPEHDRLVAHFHQISGHPEGADLMFFPKAVAGNTTSARSVVEALKLYRRNTGLPGFKPSAPAPTPKALNEPLDRSGLPIISPEIVQRMAARAAAKAHWNVAFAAQVAAANDLDVAERQADFQLNHLEMLLRDHHAHPLLTPGLVAEKSQLQALAALIMHMTWAHRHAELSLRAAVGRRASTLRGLEITARAHAQRARLRPDPHAQQAFEHITALLTAHQQRFTGMQAHEQRLRDQTQQWLARAKHQQLTWEGQLGLGPLGQAGTFTDTVGRATANPSVLLADEEAGDYFNSLMEYLGPDLAQACSSLHQAGNALDGQFQCIDVLKFSQQFAEHDRFAITVPLDYLTPNHGWDLERVATAQGHVPLALRLKTGFIHESKLHMKKVSLVNVKGSSSGAVRVRKAEWDSHRAVYRFTTDSAPTTTIFWTSSLRANNPSGADYPGVMKIAHAAAGKTDNVESDDFVVCFPPASNIKPLYVLIRDRRDYPGVVTLGTDVEGSGNPLPQAIAEAFKGRVFDCFQDMQVAIRQALPLDHPGRTRLTHRLSPRDGGKVYDLNNLHIPD
ncbi:bacteriocin immunity protein [Pseudomonas sp. TE3610]